MSCAPCEECAGADAQALSSMTGSARGTQQTLVPLRRSARQDPLCSQSKQHSQALSFEMLGALLRGQECAELAGRHKVTSSAVAQRVKKLAAELCRQGLVDDANEHQVASIIGLRRHAIPLLRALEAVSDLPVRSNRTRNPLSDEEIHRAALRLRRTHMHASRDIALFYMALATGAWPLEVARLCVRDYLSEDGSVRRQSEIRAAVAANGKARPLFFATEKLVQALDGYLQDRLRLRLGVSAQPDAYRGLLPDGALFLSQGQEGFAIVSTARGAGRTHYLCRRILDVYRDIFRRTGIDALNTRLARRTVATRLAQRGADLEQVGRVMGLSTSTAVKELITCMPRPLHEVVRDLV